MKTMKPAAFGRLCVETSKLPDNVPASLPAAFGRLCVETKACPKRRWPCCSSRLRAAVC